MHKGLSPPWGGCPLSLCKGVNLNIKLNIACARGRAPPVGGGVPRRV